MIYTYFFTHNVPIIDIRMPLDIADNSSIVLQDITIRSLYLNAVYGLLTCQGDTMYLM